MLKQLNVLWVYICYIFIKDIYTPTSFKSESHIRQDILLASSSWFLYYISPRTYSTVSIAFANLFGLSMAVAYLKIEFNILVQLTYSSQPAWQINWAGISIQFVPFNFGPHIHWIIKHIWHMGYASGYAQELMNSIMSRNYFSSIILCNVFWQIGVNYEPN